jgi:hypothetical protein
MDGDYFYATLVYRDASGGGVEDTVQYRVTNGPLVMTATKSGVVTGVRIYHKGMCVSQMPVPDTHIAVGDKLDLDLKVTDDKGYPVDFGDPEDPAVEAERVGRENERLRELLDRLQRQLDLMEDWQPRRWVDVKPKEEFL